MHLIVFFGLLVGLNYAISNEIGFPEGNSSIWFHSGLLMLILGAYWIEPFFTKPADVVINGLVVFLSISMLNNPPLSMWWSYLKFLGLALVVISLFLIWTGDPGRSIHERPAWRRLLYGVTTRAGSGSVLFSAVFVVALLAYFDLSAPETTYAVIFWAVVLAAKHLELDSIIELLYKWKSEPPQSIGRISRFAAPGVVRFALHKDNSCRRGTLVALTEHGEVDRDSPLAIVITHRTSPGLVESEALIVDSGLREGSLEKRQLIVKIDPNDDSIAPRLKKNRLASRLESVIGYATEKSDISRLFFEVVKNPRLEEGHLVSVIEEDIEVLFQLISGRLFEETSVEGSERSFAVAEAEQLGTWNKGRQGFDTHSWVVTANAPVCHVTTEHAVDLVLRDGLVELGKVPNSVFPVNISIPDLVLYHSAILGVTGSGKSFLAYHLIEQCADMGVKVLCLDVTGDYKRYLRRPTVIGRGRGAVTSFLDKPDSRIGIVEFEDDVHPIKAALGISKLALQWAKENRGDDEIKLPRPKVLLVLEEAHTLVPEWNFNPDKGLQSVVNDTSRVALQARKYGLGFMVITQRTANVVKSILNQCNTIFAFQAYDETGFDFMKNYMGQHYVKALPNLKRRQGIVVGKASVSDRPIIARFHDQDREPEDSDIEWFSPDE